MLCNRNDVILCLVHADGIILSDKGAPRRGWELYITTCVHEHEYTVVAFWVHEIQVLLIPNSFTSSDQVGAPLQGCGHLRSYGDHTHAPPRSIYSVPGITINNSIRSHGNTHLQANMVASICPRIIYFIPSCIVVQHYLCVQNYNAV